MSIQNVSATDAAGWREALADTSRTQAPGQSGSGGSSLVSELSAEFAALAEMFSGMLSGDESAADTGTGGAGGATANTAGSAAEQLLGSRSVAAEQSSAAVSPAAAAASTDVNPASGARAPGAATTAAATTGGSGTATAAASSGTAGAQTPSDDSTDPNAGEASLTCCTLAQAQSVMAAFPGATLEVWTDNGPVAASSVSPGADAQMPYIVAFGTNPATGGPNLYYASAIYNSAQSGLQQTTQGPMIAGDYYVWNTTPDANGVMHTIDVGSSFAQFAQYYAAQLNAGKAVDAYVYTTEV